MAITAEHIRTTLHRYLDTYPEDKEALTPVVELLDARADLTSRGEFRGHATAGAILAGTDGTILHIHHLALDRWLLPGGHLETGDASLLDAALRELAEETGIPIDAVTPMGAGPIHIDVHSIPANPAKCEPEHRHVDFRYLFRTAADVGELQAEEVTGSDWRSISSLHGAVLRQRVTDALGEGPQPLTSIQEN